MRQLRTAVARLAGLFRTRRADDDLRDELQAHLDFETAENIRRGMRPDEARRQALLASGGLTQAAEAVRDQRGVPWMEHAVADARYAARALRHSPVFTAVVVLTLALGIGANTAIFSVVRGVLLKPLPHRDGDRLVYLRHSADGPGRDNLTFSVPEVRDFRTGAPSLAGIAEYSSYRGILQGRDDAVQLRLGLVTGNFFEVMGLAPVLGRLTRPSDDGPGVPPVMVLTHEFWRRRFGGDSSIVGREVRLDSRAVTVIGVVQPAPTFPERMDALVNMVFSPHHLSALMLDDRTHRMTEVVARLSPGVSLSRAQAEVATVYARMQQDFGEAYTPAIHMRVAAMPFKDVLGERARLTLWLLMGAAGFVLIISAANVTNLTLMRGVRREHELVVRVALGAGVARLRQLLLAENLVVTLLGAGVGLVIAIGGVDLLTSLAARYSPRATEIRLDAMVLGYALAVAVVLALLLSFAGPLPQEGALASWVASGRRSTAGSRKHRLQRSLVVAQVAASVMLLAGAGLLVRTLVQISNVSTGLETENVLTMDVHLLGPTETNFDPNAAAAARNRAELIRLEVAALPGVLGVGLGSPLLQRSYLWFEVEAEGKPLGTGEARPNAEVRAASPGYFGAAGIRLLRGREFAPTDRPDSAGVVIINQTLADRLFPKEDPIGKRIAGTGAPFTPVSANRRVIVAVVADTRDGGLDAASGYVVFFPSATGMYWPGAGAGLVIRCAGDASAPVQAATRIIRRIAPSAAIENVKTVTQIKDDSVAPRRLNAALISSFGGLALLMAAVGIAGVLGFSVSARTNEIGIRMSLGADPGRVQRMILGEGGALLAVGLALGVAGAVAGGRLIRGLLFGVDPYDPATFLAVIVLMAVIGIVACWIPARRAARIDPAVTMRSL